MLLLYDTLLTPGWCRIKFPPGDFPLFAGLLVLLTVLGGGRGFT